MTQKFINWIDSSQKETFTKQELLDMINSYNYEEDGFFVIENSLSIKHKDKIENIPKKQFELIKMLMKNKGTVVNRDQMIKNVWESDVIVGERTIDVHIRKIRKTFPEIPIVTKKCHGYMWE
jgi:two-component system alkaline phosphatase synthesis response regulator PhoP